MRQNKPLGLGHAVACAAHLIGDEPFAVVLPDDVIRGEAGGLAQLVEAHAEVGGCVVAATRVPKSEISQLRRHRAGRVRVQGGARLTRAAGLVEKPAHRGCPERPRRRGAVYSDAKRHAAAGDSQAEPGRRNSAHGRHCGGNCDGGSSTGCASRASASTAAPSGATSRRRWRWRWSARTWAATSGSLSWRG